mmetsp:Transcript_8658/g.28353  ORF Transcript_8658/g.28353 Transcript_8658/m.28353 type:complete len:314 (+) Transcript_8658:1324-2265(+)
MRVGQKLESSLLLLLFPSSPRRLSSAMTWTTRSRRRKSSKVAISTMDARQPPGSTSRDDRRAELGNSCASSMALFFLFSAAKEEAEANSESCSSDDDNKTEFCCCLVKASMAALSFGATRAFQASRRPSATRRQRLSEWEQTRNRVAFGRESKTWSGSRSRDLVAKVSRSVSKARGVDRSKSTPTNGKLALNKSFRFASSSLGIMSSNIFLRASKPAWRTAARAEGCWPYRGSSKHSAASIGNSFLVSSVSAKCATSSASRRHSFSAANSSSFARASLNLPGALRNHSSPRNRMGSSYTLQFGTPSLRSRSFR